MAHMYPSLEDMKVDQLIQAQQTFTNQVSMSNRALTGGTTPYSQATSYPPQTTSYYPQTTAYAVPATAPTAAALYPVLDNYMGLEITPQMIHDNMNVATVNQNSQVSVRGNSSGMQVVAPVTGNSIGLMRSEIKQGVREIVLCKDQDGKVGLRVKAVNKGVFVAFVHSNSPAALVGLRFGDQILQINGQTVAGWDTDKTLNFVKKSPATRITMAVRDRPFERTVTLQKDSAGTVGFVFKDNKITAIVKDSSAARNGVLTDHHLVEVNGQNVIGLKEKDIKAIMDSSSRTVTITIIPSFIYEHIIKNIGSGLIHKKMDHSIPDF